MMGSNQALLLREGSCAYTANRMQTVAPRAAGCRSCALPPPRGSSRFSVPGQWKIWPRTPKAPGELTLARMTGKKLGYPFAISEVLDGICKFYYSFRSGQLDFSHMKTARKLVFQLNLWCAHFRKHIHANRHCLGRRCQRTDVILCAH